MHMHRLLYAQTPLCRFTCRFTPSCIYPWPLCLAYNHSIACTQGLTVCPRTSSIGSINQPSSPTGNRDWQPAYFNHTACDQQVDSKHATSDAASQPQKIDGWLQEIVKLTLNSMQTERQHTRTMHVRASSSRTLTSSPELKAVLIASATSPCPSSTSASSPSSVIRDTFPLSSKSITVHCVMPELLFPSLQPAVPAVPCSLSSHFKYDFL